MSRPRFLADHNFNEIIVDGLSRVEPSVEIVLARQLDLQQAPDPELLAFAAREGRVVVTHDLATMVGFAYDRITARQSMPGLIAVPQSLRAKTAIDELHLVWAAAEAEELSARVIFLPL